jgi:CheY-like chemotaxis protein/anti-sigma regulatory factor (Ser/Thr protein kinase)
MNSILGFSELLESELRDSKHRHYIQSVRSSASSLLQLINDVLDLSKIDAGAMKLRPEPTDPREACEFIQTVFAESASIKGVKLHCHIANDLPRSLLIDRLRLRQILVNLVGNAVKFTDQGRIDIKLSWEREERSSHINLLIEVSDTGVGIPEERLAVIFQPFVQAESHRAKERQGSGLGLSIVKRLTEAMDGTISVASVVGQGSSFRLRFKNVPISARLAASDQDEDGVAVDFNELKPAQILVVDDNEQNRELLAGIFNGTHHRLVFGRNGREAVEKAREARPDVTLLDIRMPEMNGEVALSAIRQTPGLELMPVIAVTASSMIEQDLTLEEKFNGFLRKPFSRRQLFAELAHFLPRQPKSTDAPHDPEISAIGGDWRDLASQLRRMTEEEWPALRDGLAINESLAFARKLEALGRKTNCRPLLKYAQSVSGHAESYAAGPLERQLLEFPALVDQIERAAHN